MPTKSVTIRIDEDLLKYLSNRAEREHRTVSNMILSILQTEEIRNPYRTAQEMLQDKDLTPDEAIRAIEDLLVACTPNSKYFQVGRMAIKAIQKSS